VRLLDDGRLAHAGHSERMWHERIITLLRPGENQRFSLGVPAK
jgi:hypothetical protein